MLIVLATSLIESRIVEILDLKDDDLDHLVPSIISKMVINYQNGSALDSIIEFLNGDVKSFDSIEELIEDFNTMVKVAAGDGRLVNLMYDNDSSTLLINVVQADNKAIRDKVKISNRESIRTAILDEYQKSVDNGDHFPDRMIKMFESL